MNRRSEWKQPDSFWEEITEKQAADARALGDAYIRYWAGWCKQDPDMPRLKRPMMAVLADSSRYADETKVRKEARGEWLHELADAVGSMVLALPAPEKEAVLACYLRVKLRHKGNAEWVEHIREWRDDGCARHLGIHRATLYRRLGRARMRVESGAEQMGLIKPPDMDT